MIRGGSLELGQMLRPYTYTALDRCTAVSAHTGSEHLNTEHLNTWRS